MSRPNEEAEMIRALMEEGRIVSIAGRCPDSGACHHDCTTGCFRVAHCGPLSGVFEGDVWPPEAHEFVPSAPGAHDSFDVVGNRTGFGD